MIETGDILYVPILYQPIGHDAQLQQVSAPSPEPSGPYRCLRQVWLQVKIGLRSKVACSQAANKPPAYARHEQDEVVDPNRPLG